MRVLLVDSASEVLPDGAAQLLSDSGWTVQTAGDYRQAADLTLSLIHISEPTRPY